MQSTIQSSLPFKAGLTTQILKLQKCVVPNDVEKYLYLNNKIIADFKNNKPLATSTLLSITVLKDFFKKFKGFNFFIPSINVYEQSDLISNLPLHNFCIPEDQFVLADKPYFKSGSIFYEKQNSLEEMDAINEYDYSKNKRSSNHFLAEILHEMMHAVYLSFIKGRQSSNVILENLQSKVFNSEENKIIANTIGEYATTPQNQYHEVFAETFTQLICKSLSPNSCSLMNNPFEILKDYPKEFLAIIKNVLSFNQTS